MVTTGYRVSRKYYKQNFFEILPRSGGWSMVSERVVERVKGVPEKLFEISAAEWMVGDSEDRIVERVQGVTLWPTGNVDSVSNKRTVVLKIKE